MKAVFRTWKSDGSPFLLLPEQPADPFGRFCTSVDQFGHGGADYGHCIAQSRPATAAEVDRLWGHLRNLDYRPEELQPVRRVPFTVHQARHEAARAI